jgi:multiple sugar transport system permease protein
MKKLFYKIEPYLYLAPTLIGLILFSFGAVIMTLLISFTKWDIFSSPLWVGIDNYVKIFKSEIFWQVFQNTFYYVIINVPLNVILPLLVAILINRKLKGMLFFRTVYFLPVVSSMVAVSLIWSWLYKPEYGLLNYMLNNLFGIKGIEWLENENMAMISIAIVTLWKNLGYNMVIFLAGLQNIPTQLYESAEIDGANAVHRFFKITLPMLSPTTFFVLIITLIGSFQVFEQTFILTKGGPANSTLTLSYYIYQNAFQYFRMGHSAAMSYILFIIIFLITMVQFNYQKKWVHYG